MIHFLLLFSRQGKVRLSKYYSTFNQRERNRVRFALAHSPVLPVAPLTQRCALELVRSESSRR